MQRYGRFNRPGLRGSANYALLGGTEGAAPSPPPGPPSPSWTLDFSTGEPWANGTNYTFSSTASTSRTFVNSSGFVAPCVANLLQHSGEFENAYWDNTNNATCAGVASPTAPDNSTDAAQLTETTANGIHARGRNIVTTSTGAITLSAYVKKGSRQYVGLYHITIGGNSYRAIFDLDNNAAFSAGNPSGTPNASYGSESVGNGWFRIWITLTAGNATGYPGVFLSDRAGFTGTLASGIPSYTGSTSASVYVWGLQCVEGSAPLPYSATTTSSNGIPRLTHNSSGSRLGLLVEEQRANLLLRSEEFNQAGGWPTLNGVSIGANVTTAPDNTSTADELIEDSATSRHNVVTGIRTVSQSLPYTASCYVKANNRSYCAVTLVGAGGTGARFCQVFNLTGSGSLGSIDTLSSPTGTSGTITAVGNGWFRVTATMDSQTNTAIQVAVSASNSATPTFASQAPSYLGAGNSAIYVWGAQLEQGSAASSYIPTTTATVTRSADIVSVATSNITGFANNSTLLVEYYRPATNGMVTATNEATVIMGNTGFIGVRSVNTATQSDVAWGMGWTQSGANGTLTGTVNATLQKFAYTINSGGTLLKSCMNGSMLTTSKTGDDPNMTLPDKLFLGQEEGGTLYSNVIIRKVAFYDSVLSDADMQTITT